MQNLQKKFTYGFEIEGAFTHKLADDLEKLRAKGLTVDFKGDGSVNVNAPSFADVICDDEINIGVFKSFKNMLKVLAMFKNNKNYFQNSTCGLHIHIKPIGKNKDSLRFNIGDYNFLRKVQTFCEKELCHQIQKRITGQDGLIYCKGERGFKKLLRNWKIGQKYVFLRNHPSGTFEFRLFDTCNNKVAEVDKFFKFFFETLEKMEKYQQKIINLQSKINENIKIDYKIDKQKADTYKENYILAKNDDLKLHFSI